MFPDQRKFLPDGYPLGLLLGGMTWLVLALLIPNWTAQANAAPPPTVIWFLFAADPAVQGAQLLSCGPADAPAHQADCSQPVLLLNWGSCNTAGCLSGPPALARLDDRLECFAERCLASSRSFYGGYYRLVLQIQGRVLSSAPVGDMPAGFAKTSAWHVTIQDQGLVLQADPTFQPPTSQLSGLGRSFVLTLTVELLVAVALLGLAWKLRGRALGLASLSVAAVNLLSYFPVWIYFPALQRYHTYTAVNTGVFSLLAAAILAGLLVLWTFTRGRWRWLILALTVSAVPVLLFIFLGLQLSAGYGGNQVQMKGISATTAILLAELFAFSFEWLLLAVLNRERLSVRQAAVLSLLANAASFTAGFLLGGSI